MLRIKKDAYTFDDLLLLPRYSKVLPIDVDTRSRLTPTIGLGVPILSAAMDTVTEARMAIALAKAGGMGVIHKNMSIQRQADEARKVKKHESGVVRHPITIHQDATLDELRALTERHDISGVPVMDQPKSTQLAGIVTARDTRCEDDGTKKVKSVMTPLERLITAPQHIKPAQARRLMHKNRIEKLLLIENQRALAGMMTLRDIQNEEQYPNACKDEHGRLCTAASIGTDAQAIERAEALAEVGTDMLVLDTAHGHSQKVLDIIKHCRRHLPAVAIIGGNIATPAAALALAKAGAAAVKVGIGPGTICTTRVVTGVGVPQLSAIADVCQALRTKYPRIGVIADGGIRFSGDLVKALAAGASAVMLGGLLAGTDEAPGEIVLYQGRAYKKYHGMGSLKVLKENTSDRYFQRSREKLVPEGVEGMVPRRGPVNLVIDQLVGGLCSAMGYLGCRTMAELMKNAEFVRVTKAGVQESHVHDVQITSEAPNYYRE